ncbi:hypothetical protein DDR33_08930 [Pararcticibacter amylolyticus]|uniref:Uncharacterized protein n=1 Tax=Pararcticibacter amylolyticus TaxID=2173175 RepID=A0A2U2PIE9_9SPHI|nr:hypothetical protein DDR33_08930 [Pararcticibacter amylolyticus]
MMLLFCAARKLWLGLFCSCSDLEGWGRTLEALAGLPGDVLERRVSGSLTRQGSFRSKPGWKLGVKLGQHRYSTETAIQYPILYSLNKPGFEIGQVPGLFRDNSGTTGGRLRVFRVSSACPARVGLGFESQPTRRKHVEKSQTCAKHPDTVPELSGTGYSFQRESGTS